MMVSECHGTTRPTRRTIGLLSGALLLLAITAGCNQAQRTFQVGERVPLGGVVYTVRDTQWLGELDTGTGTAVTPKHRFLAIHVTINNSGSKEVMLPLLNLVDSAGVEHLEVSELNGLPEWLGMLRPINPTESREGRIVFDVPMGAYQLKVTDGGEQEVEKTALVVLPQVPKGGPLDSPLLNEPKPQE